MGRDRVIVKCLADRCVYDDEFPHKPCIHCGWERNEHAIRISQPFEECDGVARLVMPQWPLGPTEEPRIYYRPGQKRSRPHPYCVDLKRGRMRSFATMEEAIKYRDEHK